MNPRSRALINTCSYMIILCWCGAASSMPSEFEPGEKLGPEVNSDSDEYACQQSADGRTLYFSSNRPGGYGDYDLYAAHFEAGVWQDAVNLGPSVNTEYEESQSFVSNDGSLLIFSSSRPDETVEVKRPGATHLRAAAVRKDGFRESYPLPRWINASMHTSRPFVSPDNKHFLFAAFGRDGNYGKWDIWAATIDREGYGLPVNLGEHINASERTSSPSLSKDARYLFFIQQIPDAEPAESVDRPLFERQGPQFVVMVSRFEGGQFSAPVQTNIPAGDIDSVYLAVDGSGLLYSCRTAGHYDIWFAATKSSH